MTRLHIGMRNINILRTGVSQVLLQGRFVHLSCARLMSSARNREKPQPSRHGKNINDIDEVRKIRNIGIMAHIDAGKTTTTERMLFYSGITNHIGDVDDGDTVTDYMEQERDRGITITSAAVSFPWKKYKINLIDTPGHIDFTLEVERSLRVMDGVIAVLDASAGVEAQTVTVWKQANKFQIPRIIFLNKMDKPGADFNMSVQSVEEKFKVQTLPLQLPIGSGKSFSGVIDLVSMCKLSWPNNEDGRIFSSTKLDPGNDSYEEAHFCRSTLMENLATLDDAFAEMYLSDTELTNVPNIEIHNAIRRAVIRCGAVPVTCGTSLKNKGVQPLLDSVVYYLPDPSQQQHDFIEYYRGGLCALAFKTVHDKQRGALTFVRLYSGSISSGDSVYNVNRGCSEKFNRLLQVNADEYKDVQSAGYGNIVALSGLRETITGDTLVSNLKAANEAEKEYRKTLDESEDDESKPVLAGLDVPDPVFFCSIEPPSMSHQRQLDHALECLTKEDPSLRLHTDENTGQVILSGMGELHLEVIKDRILKEYGVDVYMGDLQIAYKEAIQGEARHTENLDKTIGNKSNVVSITLSVIPADDESEIGQIQVVPDKDGRLHDKPLKRYQLKAITAGVKSGLRKGPLLGFPVDNAKVVIHDFSMRYGTSVPMVIACTAQCVMKALRQTSPLLLEPMMLLEINTDESRIGAILADLSQRRSQILDISGAYNSKVVRARTPLSQMMGYSTALRTKTSGTATFHMEISDYEQVDENEQNNLVRKNSRFPIF